MLERPDEPKTNGLAVGLRVGLLVLGARLWILDEAVEGMWNGGWL